jgi:hypothetical protein
MCLLIGFAVLCVIFFIFQYWSVLPTPHLHDWSLYEFEVEIHKNKKYSYTIRKCTVCGTTSMEINSQQYKVS